MPPAPSGWFNRTVIGAGVTSFLADACYETATSILPAFLLILGLSQNDAARALGAIEGVADLLANVVKIAVGWYSDRIGHRKTFVVAGYGLTGSAFALCAFAVGWPLVMVAKSLAWIGKGIRGPLRNAILAEQQVTCFYEGRKRELCPHIIGRNKSGEEAVLAWQFGGESSGPLPQWRCLRLANVRDARMRKGRWYAGGSHRTEQTCVVDIDLDINVHVRKLR